MAYYSQKYDTHLKDYKEKQLEDKLDFTNLIPMKRLEFFNNSHTDYNLLGFTYLFGDYVAIADNLSEKKKREVDIHEHIHTEDEYETRVLTWWHLDNKPNRYQASEDKYKKNIEDHLKQ